MAKEHILAYRVATVRRLTEMQELLAYDLKTLLGIEVFAYERRKQPYHYFGCFSLTTSKAIPHFVRLPRTIHVVLPSGLFSVNYRSFQLAKLGATEQHTVSDFYLSVCDFHEYIPCPSLVSRKIAYCPLRALVSFASACLGCARAFRFDFMSHTYYVAPQLFPEFSVPNVAYVFEELPQFDWLKSYERTGEVLQDAEYVSIERVMYLIAAAACMLAGESNRLTQ